LSQTFFYVDEITVQPQTPTSQDQVVVALSGGLASTGAYIVSASAAIVGTVVTLSIVAADPGGATVIVPHTEFVPLGTLASGNYSIVIEGQFVGDFAPAPQHLFMVIGSGSSCDGLELVSIQWHALTDTAIMVHVLNTNVIGELFDYPNFILYDANGDTLAMESVFYFGIGAESWHRMDVQNGSSIGSSSFSGTLELWTGFTTTLACSWALDFDLCPPPPCTTLIPNIQNLGGALTFGTFDWGIVSDSILVASGSFTLDAVQQTDADTLCLPPGSYSMLISGNGGVVGGQPYHGITVPGGIGTDVVPSNVQQPIPIDFVFYSPCIDPTLSTGEPEQLPGVHLSPRSGGFVLYRQASLLGRIMIYDAQGRLLHQRTSASDREDIDTTGWPSGIHFVEVFSPDGRHTVLRTMILE
jgi:hypothetical protein